MSQPTVDRQKLKETLGNPKSREYKTLAKMFPTHASHFTAIHRYLIGKSREGGNLLTQLESAMLAKRQRYVALRQGRNPVFVFIGKIGRNAVRSFGLSVFIPRDVLAEDILEEKITS